MFLLSNKVKSINMKKIYIKNMVSLRCKMRVIEELNLQNLKYGLIELGIIEIINEISDSQLTILKENLSKSGLEIIDDKKSILIEKIKNTIIEMVHYTHDLPKEKYSHYLSHKIGYDYTYISNVFSEINGVTIQQFIINHKVEKIKELMMYNEYSLTEISHRMHYSSVAHLSNQFKKITGLSPSFYKQMKQKRTCNLENL